MFKKNKKTIGNRGEDLATEFLKNRGFRILERNLRKGKKEIDIIAEKNCVVHFVEVKTTASDLSESFKFPRESVNFKKRENIISCAREYIAERRRKIFDLDEEYAFSVIEVYLNREVPEINFYENAFYVEKGKNKNGKSHV